MERETDAVYIEIDPHDVNYVNRILEGYEYLGVLTTIDVTRAICCIHSTADTKAEVREILGELPDVKVRFLSDEEINKAIKNEE